MRGSSLGPGDERIDPAGEWIRRAGWEPTPSTARGALGKFGGSHPGSKPRRAPDGLADGRNGSATRAQVAPAVCPMVGGKAHCRTFCGGNGHGSGRGRVQIVASTGFCYTEALRKIRVNLMSPHGFDSEPDRSDYDRSSLWLNLDSPGTSRGVAGVARPVVRGVIDRNGTSPPR
jgi:hypothetical protein